MPENPRQRHFYHFSLQFLLFLNSKRIEAYYLCRFMKSRCCATAMATPNHQNPQGAHINTSSRARTTQYLYGGWRPDATAEEVACHHWTVYRIEQNLYIYSAIMAPKQGGIVTTCIVHLHKYQASICLLTMKSTSCKEKVVYIPMNIRVF